MLNTSSPSAVINTTGAYARGGATSVRRGVSFTDDYATYVVSDEWSHKTAKSVLWKMHTTANVTLSTDGRTAVLSQYGTTLNAAISKPAAAKFNVHRLDLPAPQVSGYNGGSEPIQVLTVTVPASAGGISVVFGKAAASARVLWPVVHAVDTWADSGVLA